MELDKTAEARRKAQRNGEEDPVVVAQRFLNIYRQLHIFPPEKKEAFNQMLLALPPTIRGIFGQLPGGALLQDYVDELTDSKGMAHTGQTVAPTSDSAALDDDSNKQAKILATALAEAHIQAAAKMQDMNLSSAAMPLSNVAPAAAPSPAAKLSIDAGFAQELAGALAAALKPVAAGGSMQSDSGLKEAVSELGQSQLEILKNMQAENSGYREEIKQLTEQLAQAVRTQPVAAAANNTRASTEEESGNTSKLLQMLVVGQKKMTEYLSKIEASAPKSVSAPVIDFKELGAALTRNEQNLSKIMVAMNEQQKHSSAELARFFDESQQKLMKLVVQHNTANQNQSQNNNNIQINSADYSVVLNKIAEELSNLKNLMPTAAPVSAAPAASAPVSSSPVSAATIVPTDIQINFSEKALDQMIRAQTKIYREIAEAQTQELSAIIKVALEERPNIVYAAPAAAEIAAPPSFAPAAVESVPTAEPEPVSVFSEKPAAEPASTAEPEPVAEPAAVMTPEPSLAETAAPSPEIVKKKKKKKKKKTSPVFETGPAVETVSPSEIKTFVEPELTPVFEPEPTPEPVSEPVFESQPEPESQFAPSSEPAPDPESELAPEPEPVSASSASANIWAEPEPEPEVEMPSVETMPESFDLNADDWGFTSVAEPQSTEPEPAAENTDPEDENAGEGEDWEWEYLPADEAAGAETSTSSLTEPQFLGEHTLLRDGNLFFQKNVFKPQPLADSPITPYIEDIPAIFDSAAKDKKDNPYKNSVRKD